MSNANFSVSCLRERERSLFSLSYVMWFSTVLTFHVWVYLGWGGLELYTPIKAASREDVDQLQHHLPEGEWLRLLSILGWLSSPVNLPETVKWWSLRMAVFHKKWDQPPFSDTSYSTVSIWNGTLCWSLYSTPLARTGKFPLKLLLLHVVAGDSPSSICWGPPMDAFGLWSLSVCSSDLVEAGEVLLSIPSTLGTKVGSTIRMSLAWLCFIPFSPSGGICLSG